MSEQVADTPQDSPRRDDHEANAGRDPLSMLFQPGAWRLERRLYTRPVYELYATLIALAITAVIIGLLVIIVGVSPLDAFSSR